MNCATRDDEMQWMIRWGDGYQACGRTTKQLPPGAYTCQIDHCSGTPWLARRPLNTDELIDFADSLPARIFGEIERFWGLGERFARFGFLHRRGYLLYGKQGGGKSSLIHQIAYSLLGAGHVAFFCDNPHYFLPCLTQFRQVEPERPMVCVFEDIDAIIKEYGDSQVLQWLDGNLQVNRVVNLATTNYPEKLDRRLVARPRRFDRVHRIDAPDARYREAYFARKLPELPAQERRRWVSLSEGLPFAALAELIISACCLGHDLEESAELLRQLDKQTPSSAEFAEGEADGLADHLLLDAAL